VSTQESNSDNIRRRKKTKDRAKSKTTHAIVVQKLKDLLRFSSELTKGETTVMTRTFGVM
ncbi:hypothetical protein Pfo_018859, partial [Paulownia fortunei]